MSKCLSGSYCLCRAQQIPVYQTVAFPSPCEQLSSALSSQTTTHNTFFCLQLKTVLKVRASTILANSLVFLDLTRVYMILNFDFLLFICLMPFNSKTSQKNLEGQKKLSSALTELGHEGEGLVNDTGALNEGTPESSLTLFLP